MDEQILNKLPDDFFSVFFFLFICESSAFLNTTLGPPTGVYIVVDFLSKDINLMCARIHVYTRTQCYM